MLLKGTSLKRNVGDQRAKKVMSDSPGLVDFAIGLLKSVLNPFAPEPPVTARADPGPFYPL